MLDLIEPTGWITADIDEFIDKNNLNLTLNVLQKLQKLEPIGVFSKKFRGMFEDST